MKWHSQGIAVSGSVEQLIMLQKDSLRTTLDKVCARRKVSCVEDLLGNKTAGTLLPDHLHCSLYFTIFSNMSTPNSTLSQS